MSDQKRIIVRLTSPLTVNSLLFDEYYHAFDIARRNGTPLPKAPPMVPESEDYVLGEQIEEVFIHNPRQEANEEEN